MKYFLTYSLIISSLLCFSCNTDESEESDNIKEKSNNPNPDEEIAYETPVDEEADIANFRSEIRPNKKDWDPAVTYTDTLIFESFEDNYDYWYAFFTTTNGTSVNLAYDEFIDESLKGSSMLVKWEVDSLYEAGEGDALYYKERLISYEVLEAGSEFDGFLKEFIKAYSRKDEQLIQKYLHDEVSFTSAYNPGVYCLASNDKPTVESFISWDCVVKEGKPKGEFCEGYAGVEDGLYYETISMKDLPFLADMDDNGPFDYQPNLPKKFENTEMKKVWVILNEFHYRYLYFFKSKGQWYFWLENNCDCSA